MCLSAPSATTHQNTLRVKAFARVRGPCRYLAVGSRITEYMVAGKARVLKDDGVDLYLLVLELDYLTEANLSLIHFLGFAAVHDNTWCFAQNEVVLLACFPKR